MSKTKLRHTLERVITTLERRSATTIDAAEASTLGKCLPRLHEMLNEPPSEPLEVAATLLSVTDEVERAVAATRQGPFDGYLVALEGHLHQLNVLTGAALGASALARAPLQAAAAKRRSAARTRRPTFAERSLAGARSTSTAQAPATDYATLQHEYQHLYDTMQVRPAQQGAVAFYVRMLRRNQTLYDTVGHELGGIPWVFIGALHGLECCFRLDQHLHNGDPLTARTTHVPKGRPVTGKPPFTWRESAVDALRLKKLDRETDWSIARMLYLFESYNGFGYRRFAVHSPYLWSMSNHFSTGKFVADGRFDPNATSKQCGAALMLKALLP